MNWKTGFIRLTIAGVLVLSAVLIFYPLKIYHVTSDYDSGISVIIVIGGLMWLLYEGIAWVFRGFKQDSK